MVRLKLESFGLIVRRPTPDVGIDFEVYNPLDQSKYVKIQVKGRNPRIIKSYRWFQLRVRKQEMEQARNNGIPAIETWKDKVRMVDFFICVVVHFEEMWIFSQEQTFKLISLNEYQYGSWPDNKFNYNDYPLRGKKKEMNIEARVQGVSIIEEFKSCKNNFSPILNYLGIKT